MNVAFLTHEPFYPPSGGGSAEAVYLVQEFLRRGHTIDLFCPEVPDAPSVQARFNVRLHPFRRWEMNRYTRFRNFKYLLYPTFLQHLVQRHYQQHRPDLVLSQHAISAVAAGKLKTTLNVPVVMNFLDHLTGFMETWPPYLAPPPLLRRLMHYELSLPSRYHADGVLAVSDTLADRFTNAGVPPERVCPIYYGFDSNLFPFHGRTDPGESGTATIVMHGSLDHHHLKQTALGAIEYMAQRRRLRLRIIGKHTPALRFFLKQLRQRTPSVTLDCPGFIPYDEIAPHLADASVGIVPYEESAGTHSAFVAKTVEYLAVGVPVVCTRLESISRYFKNEPMIGFTDFDGRAFGRQIDFWLQPGHWNSSRAKAASERVRTELDWRVISRKAVDFIEQTYHTARRGLS